MADEKVEPICPVCGSPVSFESFDGGAFVASCSNKDCLAFFIEGEALSEPQDFDCIESYNDFIMQCMGDGKVSQKISSDMAKRCGEAVAMLQDEAFFGNVVCPECGGEIKYSIFADEAMVLCSECPMAAKVEGWRDGITFKDALWNLAALGKTVVRAVGPGWGGAERLPLSNSS